MDILCKLQSQGHINITIPMVLEANTPDTGLVGGTSFLVKAIDPDGAEATFTAPTVTEIIAGSGVYKMIFPSDATTKLFTQTNSLNPYTLVINSTSATNTGRKVIRVYCVDRLPGEIALSAEVAAVDTLIDGAITTLNALPTLAEIEATTVLAKDATVAKAATVALDSTVAKDATVAKASSLAALQTTADAIPTLAEIEGSTILAKEANLLLVKKLIKNKKTLVASGSVYSLVVYDDNDIDEIMRKVIKDISGADITAIGAGVIAREMKSSV